jgi:hypothetical protein
MGVAKPPPVKKKKSERITFAADSGELLIPHNQRVEWRADSGLLLPFHFFFFLS